MVLRAIGMATAALLAIAAPAHAASTVAPSSISLKITLDAVATDVMSITVPTPGTFRVTDTAGVIKNPDSESVCTQVNGQTLDCPYSQSFMPRVDIISPAAKPGRDTVDASGAPTRVTLLAPVNEIDITGTAFNDILRGSVGADILRGGGGTDQLTGGAGADTLSGGPGSDTVFYDTDHTGGINVTIGSGSGDDGNAQDGPAGARDTVLDAEGLTGTAGSDRLSGDGSPTASPPATATTSSPAGRETTSSTAAPGATRSPTRTTPPRSRPTSPTRAPTAPPVRRTCWSGSGTWWAARAPTPSWAMPRSTTSTAAPAPTS